MLDFRLKQFPKDFTWDELVALLEYLGFEEVRKGKTGGFRRYFKNKENIPIRLHEPHPSKVLNHMP